MKITLKLFATFRNGRFKAEERELPEGALSLPWDPGAAFAVGEFGSRHTAFYMFSFRDPDLAPPGAADLLLARLLEEAGGRGQALLNLGLCQLQGGEKSLIGNKGYRRYLCSAGPDHFQKV